MQAVCSGYTAAQRIEPDFGAQGSARIRANPCDCDITACRALCASGLALGLAAAKGFSSSWPCHGGSSRGFRSQKSRLKSKEANAAWILDSLHAACLRKNDGNYSRKIVGWGGGLEEVG